MISFSSGKIRVKIERRGVAIARSQARRGVSWGPLGRRRITAVRLRVRALKSENGRSVLDAAQIGDKEIVVLSDLVTES